MAENGPIEDLAKRISEDLLSRFKWQQHGPCDRDFLCDDEAKHKPCLLYTSPSPRDA
mgnify:CR=1 FL=1